MYCTSCGNPVETGSRFCTHCGAPVAAAAPQNARRAGRTPVKPRRKGPSPWLIVGVAAVVLALVAGGAFLLLSGTPAGQIASAFSATAEEFAKVGDVFSWQDASGVLNQDAMSMEMDLRVQDFGEEPGLAGFGVLLQTDVNLKKREMAMQAIPYYGSVELLNVALAMEDANLYLSAPQFLPDPFYGVNTVTVMEDLAALGADPGEEFRGMGFNFFDMAEALEKESKTMTEETQKVLEKANAELVKAIVIEKEGKETVEVNGTDTKCTLYTVTLPCEALKTWVDDCADVISGMDYTGMMDVLYDQMNIPAELRAELEAEMAYSMSGTEVDVQELKDALDMLGDMVVDIYISSGKIAAVEYVAAVDGTTVEMGLYIGGGEEYVDDITFEMTAEGETLRFASSGDHTGKSGTFTDSTYLYVPYEGEVMAMNSEYNLKSGDFTYELIMEGLQVMTMEGNLEVGKKALTLEVRELVLWDSWSGEKMMDLQLTTTVSEYERHVKPENAVMLSEMTMEDVMNIASQVEGNAMSWAMDIMTRVPELTDLF